MKNSKTMALGLCVVLLVAMTGGIAAGADNPFSAIMDAGGEVAGAAYYINIPGDGWTIDTYSDLNDDVFGSTTGTPDADVYVVTVGIECIAVGFCMMDCCIPGDTVAFGVPPAAIFSALSPMPACVGAYLPPGTYNIYAGYVLPNNGVFPAGYDMKIKGYWPVPAGAESVSNVE